MSRQKERCWYWGWMELVRAASFVAWLVTQHHLLHSQVKALTLFVSQQPRFRCPSGKVRWLFTISKVW